MKKEKRKNIRFYICKIFIAFFLCLMAWDMILDMVSEAASAEPSIVHSGTSGGITWTIDSNGQLKLEGTGDYEARQENEYRYAPWHEHRSEIKSAVVDIREITNTAGMFYECEEMRSVDLTQLDTSKVTTMRWMFGDCIRLDSLDVTGFNTSNVTDMARMFSGCTNLTALDLSNFNTSKVNGMFGMFYLCGGLSALDLSSFDTSKVSTMGRMFEDCENLTSLDLSGFTTSSTSSDVGYMFLNCISLTSLDLSRFDMSNVSTTIGMFSGCKQLVSLRTPVNLKKECELPLSDDEKKWYNMDGTEVTTLPLNSNHSVTLVRQEQPPTSGESVPGTKLPNTSSENHTRIHIVVFCIFGALTLCVYGLKKKYVQKRSYES